MMYSTIQDLWILNVHFTINAMMIGGSSELPMWLTDGFWGDFFLEGGGGAVCIHVRSRAVHMCHMQLTCGN